MRPPMPFLKNTTKAALLLVTLTICGGLLNNYKDINNNPTREEQNNRTIPLNQTT